MFGGMPEIRWMHRKADEEAIPVGMDDEPGVPAKSRSDFVGWG